MDIRAVLFDLDNTLTHRNQSIHAYVDCLVQYYQQNIQYNQRDKIIEIIHRIDNGGYPIKALLTHPSIAASVAYALLQEIIWTSPPSVNELTQFWFQQFAKNAVAMHGAAHLLLELQEQNLKLAVVSNGGHATRLSILQGLGFYPYFDRIISSESVGISKPNVEIFLETSHQLQVDPEHCLVVGDHPINDILGAQNAGMHAVWMQGFHAKTSNVRHCIQHLSQVLDMIKS
jgi:putative hydrolase of the HAD superfamily